MSKFNLVEEKKGTQSRVPVSKDLIHKAMIEYPGYDSQQALILYIADRMENQQKTDAMQNKVINAQKRENEKLSGTLNSLGQELQDVEQQSQDTDREIARLKQLSAKLRPAGEISKQAVQASASELEKVSKELDSLKSRPDIDIEKFKNIEQQVKKIQSNPKVDDAELKNVQSMLNAMQQKQGIGDELYNKVIQQLKQTQDSLEGKEQRFKKYIKKSGDQARTSSEEIKKYAAIVDSYKEKIDNFDQFMKDKAEEIGNLVDYAKAAIPGPTGQQHDTGQAQAGNTANQIINKAKTSSRVPQGLDQQYKQSEKERSFSNIVGHATNESIVTELIRPAKDYGVAEYNEWLARDLPVLVKIFKNKYYRELENKNPTYGDQQIAYTCEEHAPYLWNIGQTEEPVITKRQMDVYLTAVKVDLFRQPVEQEQIDLFNESLDKTYARMLDNIIGLDYIKKG